jgi:cytoskeletal protein RodZ
MGAAALRHYWLTAGLEPSNRIFPTNMEAERMDEELVETDVPTVGQRLREAREEKGLNLEDVAAQTRIPRRHLESLETGEWDKLPAPTYTVGFAKSYATAIGLDRTEIGDQLRAEMGGKRPTTVSAEVFEPADPARTMPKWLVFGAIAGVVLLVLVLGWLNERSLQDSDAPESASAAAGVAATQAPAAAPRPTAPAAQGPVVLTASEPVWLQVTERGGGTLFEGELAAGQVYAVPVDAKAPLLKTGKPQALKVTVGNAVAPAVGPAATTVRDVSLLGPDLMRGGAPAAPAPAGPAR